MHGIPTVIVTTGCKSLRPEERLGTFGTEAYAGDGIHRLTSPQS